MCTRERHNHKNCRNNKALYDTKSTWGYGKCFPIFKLLFIFILLLLFFSFPLGRYHKREGADVEGLRDVRDWGSWCEFPKELIFKNKINPNIFPFYLHRPADHCLSSTPLPVGSKQSASLCNPVAQSGLWDSPRILTLGPPSASVSNNKPTRQLQSAINLSLESMLYLSYNSSIRNSFIWRYFLRVRYSLLCGTWVWHVWDALAGQTGNSLFTASLTT